MERKAIDRRIIASLVILLAVEVTLLALHLTWGGFRPRSSANTTAVAGHVAQSENELRRRGLNSLLWEKSNSSETLYYFDSVLTLAQSTASLKLFKDTEVRLSENTLVTIEPQDHKEYGEIRLKFHRGGFQARNPFAATTVDSDGWSMEIKTGSDIDFRQVGENGYELSVKSGEVGFNSGAGVEKVSKQQVLRIQDGHLNKMQTLDDASLRWSENPPKRIYTHSTEALVRLKWQGPGSTQLLRQTLGQPEQSTALTAFETEHSLALPLGHHRLFLRRGDATSVALDIEVWPAPTIHLLMPLPRNRIQTETPTAFVWTRIPEVASFKFLLKGRSLNSEQPLQENSFSTKFGAEDDLEWSVQGVDKEGFVIPPRYSYPLYIREAPLAAPKLRVPTLRQPASKNRGAGLWRELQNLILPEAQADESEFQALFSWETVDRADHYVIEISETADFRSPLVTQTVSQNDFLWKKVQLKSYFWRVAAGTKQGRLGFFSEPQEVNLADPNAVGVEVMRVESPEVVAPLPVATESKPPPAAPVAVEEPPAAAALTPPAPPPYILPLHNRKRFEWRPAYQSIRSVGAESVHADFHGTNIKSGAVRVDHMTDPEHMLNFEVQYSQMTYQPRPKENYPFQKDLSWSDYSARGVSHVSSSPFAWGLAGRHSVRFTRKDFESIQTRDTWSVGPCGQFLKPMNKATYQSDFLALFGSDFGLTTEQRMRWTVGEIFVIGLGFDAAALFHKSGNTYSVSGQVSFGLEF